MLDDDDPDVVAARASPAGLAWYADGCNRDADTSQGWLPFPHLEKLSEALMDVAAGKTRRLIVTMPPRHGKSVLISQAFPAWYLGRYPKRQVMLASNTAALAEGFSGKARDILLEHGPDVFGVNVRTDSKAANRWRLTQGGIMVAAGVGGPLTGRGAHLLVIDDPIKNDEEAASETIRAKQWGWWLSTARTRLMKGGSVVVVLTRWHEDDLAGRMLALALEQPGADQWDVLNLPAIAEADPESGELEDALGRGPGEALCPDLIPLEELETTRLTLGTYYWSAMFQQRPRPAEGLLFKLDDFRYWEPHPTEGGLMVLHEDGGIRTQAIEHCTLFETVDVAASEKQTADYTVISKWAVTPKRDLILLDRHRQRFEILDVGGFVKTTHESTELSSLPAHILWPGWSCPRASFTDVESFGHGLAVVQELVPQGFPIRKITPHTDKVARALVAVARYEEHRVFHPRLAPWRREWEDELLAFPTGRNDDQVDTVSMAASRLPQVAVGARRRGEQESRSRLGGVRDKAL